MNGGLMRRVFGQSLKGRARKSLNPAEGFEHNHSRGGALPLRGLGLASALAWAALALGPLPFAAPAWATTSNAYHELRKLREPDAVGLRVHVQLDPDSQGVSQPEIVAGPLELDGDSRYFKSGLAVFNSPVRVARGGVRIGRNIQYVPWLRGQEALSGSVNWGWAVFNGPVSIDTGDLAAGGSGQAVFHDAVEILHGGIKLQDTGPERAALTFQGPVAVRGGNIDLEGDNSVIFMDKVKVEPGGLYLGGGEGRASVILGGRGQVTAGRLKVSGDNRLIFSLSPSSPPAGFIQVEAEDGGCPAVGQPGDGLEEAVEIMLNLGGEIEAGQAEVDADCLVIDDPDGVAEEGEEIVLITAGKIRFKGDNRKIVTRQGDEYELLVTEKQISARLTQKEDVYIWYKTLQFNF